MGPSHDDTGNNNHWVTIDVAAEALGISVKRARAIANAEGWRTSKPGKGDRTRQYLFADIRRTYNHRKEPPE